MNELVLLRAENISLKSQNLRIIKKYKKSNSDSIVINDSESDYESDSVTTHEVQNYGIVVNQIINKRQDRAADGFFHRDGQLYELLEGTRIDVWQGKAYKTSGGLIKTDLLINKDGNIVSKCKYINAIRNNNLDGVNQQKRQRMNSKNNTATL
jgi:hypothetical protein